MRLVARHHCNELARPLAFPERSVTSLRQVLMPTRRALSTLYDWLGLRPALSAYKIARRRTIGRAYIYKKAPDTETLRNALQELGTRPLAITVVFNSTWMLKWQLRFSELNFSGVDRVIADNSYDPAAARAIEALCREANVHYL